MKKVLIFLIIIVIIEIISIVLVIKHKKKIKNSTIKPEPINNVETIKEETVVNNENTKNVKVSDDSLDLDELFKTISITQQNFDFDFGLKENNKK